MRTHNPYYARSEYQTRLAKMGFDKVFDLTAGVYFNLYIILHFAGYCVSAKNCFLHPGSFLNLGFLKEGSTVSIFFRDVFGHPCNTQVSKVPVL